MCELFEEAGLPKPTFAEIQGGLKVVVYAATPQITPQINTMQDTMQVKL